MDIPSVSRQTDRQTCNSPPALGASIPTVIASVQTLCADPVPAVRCAALKGLQASSSTSSWRCRSVRHALRRLATESFSHTCKLDMVSATEYKTRHPGAKTAKCYNMTELLHIPPSAKLHTPSPKLKSDINSPRRVCPCAGQRAIACVTHSPGGCYGSDAAPAAR